MEDDSVVQDAVLCVDDRQALVLESAIRSNRSSAILDALGRLDAILEQAVAVASETLGPDAAANRFRGLYITPEDVSRLLSRPPGDPAFHGQEEISVEAYEPDSLLDRVAKVFGLDEFDISVLLVALAPEVDLRYERIYSYLQDDVTRRRPSVELALNLLCGSVDEKLLRRQQFTADAPLIRTGLLRLRADPQHAPLLAHTIEADPGIVRYLLTDENDNVPALVSPSASAMPIATLRALAGMVVRAKETGEPARFYFQGSSGAGQREAAIAIAGEAGMSLRTLDAAELPDMEDPQSGALSSIFYRADLEGNLVFVDRLDALPNDEARRKLLAAVGEFRGVTILSGAQPWRAEEGSPSGMFVVTFSIPDYPERRVCWQARTSDAGILLSDADLDALAGRFRLTPLQISEAVAFARNRMLWRAGESGEGYMTGTSSVITLYDLLAGARAQCGAELETLTSRMHPKRGWEDIVLPPDAIDQLREICQRATHRQEVLADWGFGAKLTLGKGTTALFAGPSGTGKTLAAEVLSSALGLDLYRIDLAGVVSKYIGETEKNLDRIFTAAENANAVLFFDEADALFGKRSEVHDSHDRYANIEIAYLLQKMDQYEGIAILATNLRQNMDEAFTRRLQYIIDFPLPDEDQREAIWRVQFPVQAPLAHGADLRFLADRFNLSGGGIKNAALAAAYLAAAERNERGNDFAEIDMRSLVRASLREYQKMGRVIDESQFDDVLSPSPIAEPDTVQIKEDAAI